MTTQPPPEGRSGPRPAAPPGTPPQGARGPDFADTSPERISPGPAAEGTPSFEDPSDAAGGPDTPRRPDTPVGQSGRPDNLVGQSTTPVGPAPDSSHWPARIVAGATVLAIIAILLAIFLPKEQSEVKPQAGPATTQPTTSPTPQPQPAPSIQAASPKSVAPNPTPAPATPSPQSQQQPSAQMGTCPMCGGTGTVPCPIPAAMHDPSGRIYHPEAMGIPRGGHQSEVEARDAEELRSDLTGNVCPFCGGSLKMKCPTCGGKGRVPVGTQATPLDNLARSVGVDPKAVEALTGQGAGGQ